MNVDPSVRKISIALLLLGTTSIAVQVLLLREFISASHGNELVIGVILAQWMVLTGIGSLLGRFHTNSSPGAVLALVALLPVVIVVLLRSFRSSLFTSGSILGFTEISFLSSALLAPYCLMAGYGFVRCISALRAIGLVRSGAFAYAWESAGSVLGGLVFNILLIRFIDTLAALSILAVIDLGFTVWFFLPFPLMRFHKALLSAAIVAAGGYAALTLDRTTMAWAFPGQELVFLKGNPYGTLVITRQQEQLNFYEDNVLAFSTGDPMSNEESIHFAMAQHRNPQRVLLIGGGISGTTREALKYPVQQLDVLEQNPWILQIGRQFTTNLDDKRIHLLHEDARWYVRTTGSRYDVVIVNVPDPSTIQLNRYFALEFFRDVKNILMPGGVFSLRVLPTTEYGGERSRAMLSTISATLHRVFPHVLLLPGNRHTFLCAEVPLDAHIARLVASRNIPTEYVNAYYIDDTLLEARARDLVASLDPDAPMNADFRPLSYSQQVSYWASSFGFDPVPWIVTAATAVLLIFSWRFRPVGSAVLASGFTAASVEIVLLTAFQILYGSLYEMTGLVITAFMAGLALGSLAARRFVRRSSLAQIIALQGVTAIGCALLPSVIVWVQQANLSALSGHLVFVAATFLIAGLTGWLFSLAVSIGSGDEATRASGLYSLDLLGASAGALLTGIYIIPAVGVLNSSVVASLVSAAGVVICLLAKGQSTSSEGAHGENYS